MKKLFILTKKEIQELLTPQMIIPLLAVVLMFIFIGKAVGKEMTKNQTAQPVQVVDFDNTQTSAKFIDILKQNNLEIVDSSQNPKAVLIIPSGFEKGLNDSIPQKVEFHSIIDNFSMAGNVSNSIIGGALASANRILSGQKNLVQTNDFVKIGNKEANVSVQQVSGFINSQTIFIPIILTLVIIMASQFIVVSVASEKENKTLETLLSSPVNRQYIVASKLLGAGIVALIAVAVYLIGMSYYINGLTGNQLSQTGAVVPAMSQLGLVFGPGDYILLGISLFFGILTALAMAIILGSFTQDVKSAQGAVAPLMVLILIPYFLTMFLNISALPNLARLAIYAIPFAHPFLAASNILLGHSEKVWYGIAYMAVFFLAFVYIASKIFASDKIFSLKINFRRHVSKR